MRRAVWGIISIGLVACAATPSEGASPSRSAGSGVAVAEADVPRAGLPAQSLNPGECGLFLWSKTDISQFVFFARAGNSDALILLEDRPESVELAQARGAIFGQFLTDLTYIVRSSGQEISVSYTPGEVLTGGARVSNGRISYSGADGWTRVVPVLGVRACQPTAVDTPRPG